MTGLRDHRVNQVCNRVLRTAGAAVIFAGALGVGVSSPVLAAGADHFKDKTFVLMISSRSGGGTDTTGRLVARHWSDHIPGNPKVVIRNKPLQVIGANDLHNKVRPNGLTVAVFAGAGALGPFTRKSSSVRYDPRQWGYVGSVERGPSIQLVRRSALKRLTDKSKPAVALGSVSSDRPQDAVAVFGAEYLGWNMKFVLGYPSSSAIYLAYGRGEIDMFGSGTAKILNRFIKDEDAVPIIAQSPRGDLPGIKTFVEYLGDKKPTGDKWAAFAAWTGPSAVDKFFVAPPKTPKDILATLRASFKATTSDPRFVKAARSILGGGYKIQSAAETRQLVETAITIHPGALKEIKRLRAKYGLPSIERKAAKMVKVTFDKVQRGGRVLLFKSGGKNMKLRVSGSRTEITVGGKLAPRSAVKSGMTCKVGWIKRGSRFEASKVVCP
jgi:hypothetical protein